MKKLGFLFVSQLIQTVVLIVGLVYGVSWIFSETNKRVEQAEAQAYCMQWRMPDARVIDGEIYCVNSVITTFPNGLSIIVPQAWSQEEMEAIFSNFKPSGEFQR